MKWGTSQKQRKEEKPAPATATEPVENTNTLAVSGHLAEQFKEDAKENLKNVQDTFFRISIQGGRFSVEKQPLGQGGVKFQGIILRETPVNMFYAEKFSPTAQTTPDCWSIGGLQPDLASKNKQSDSCVTCKMNRWGSAMSMDGKKNAKACANGKRLVLKIEGIDLPVVLALPTTAVKRFNQFLKELSSHVPPIPMFAVKVEFTFDTTTQYPKPVVNVVGVIDNSTFYNAIKEYRKSEVVEKALYAYASPADTSHPEEEEEDIDK